MSRTMRDSVYPGRVPVDGTDLAAGYGTGPYTWSAAGWNRFPGKPHIKIDVNASSALCDVLDIERYAAVAADAPKWIRNRVLHGRACLYFSRLNMTAVSDACKGFNAIDVWVADWTGQPHEVTVAPNMHLVAVQYASLTNDGYDASIVYDNVWPLGEK